MMYFKYFEYYKYMQLYIILKYYGFYFYFFVEIFNVICWKNLYSYDKKGFIFKMIDYLKNIRNGMILIFI